MIKKRSFDLLSAIVAIGCLIVLNTSTTNAAPPAQCGSDHCQPPTITTCGIGGCLTTTSYGAGSKQCCVEWTDQYGITHRRMGTISYNDTFCSSDCDGDGNFTYINCSYSLTVTAISDTPC
ncbi:MAG: hypothetical protein JWN98_2629 [Abditibacteriota bacterium]|nr:hypothetical protein [Abditibacteriota bacterium]